MRDKVKAVQNTFFDATFNETELQHFSKDVMQKVFQFQQTSEKFTKTPFIALDQLAANIGVEKVFVKDESKRFGLNAFKVMGGIYAIGKYIAQLLGKDISEVTFEQLRSEEIKGEIGEITFISATDGNHGRGVAWAARELGQKAIIYMPKGSSNHRLQALKNEGAQAEITDVNYDETIRICHHLAEENGYVMVQDTAWEGYDEIPLWIMQGYATIVQEIYEDLKTMDEAPPTHVFVQAGVGSFAAGIVASFIQLYGTGEMEFFVVEPNLADCYYRSFANNGGDLEVVTGDMNSIMAGLCCGEPNVRAFRILKQYTNTFYSCEDDVAALGMRILGNPLECDEKIISGESGAVSLGLVYYLKKYATSLAEQIGLDEHARILVINSEGDTDPIHYRDVVWLGKNATM